MSFLDRLRDSLLRLWEFVPALFGAAVVLSVGYLVARLAQRTVQRLLRRVHLNEALEKGGVTPPLDPSGTPLTPTRVVSNVVFWFILFTAMLIAADTLGID
jgi:small-conductance mechanosensitive channel